MYTKRKSTSTMANTLYTLYIGIRHLRRAVVITAVLAGLILPTVTGLIIGVGAPVGAQSASAASLSYGFPTRDAELVVGMAAATVNGATTDNGQQPPLVERA